MSIIKHAQCCKHAAQISSHSLSIAYLMFPYVQFEYSLFFLVWLAACHVLCVCVRMHVHAGVVENVNDVWAVSRPGRELSDGVAWVTLLSINRPCVQGRQTDRMGREEENKEGWMLYSLSSFLLFSSILLLFLLPSSAQISWAKQEKVKKTRKQRCEHRACTVHRDKMLPVPLQRFP